MLVVIICLALFVGSIFLQVFLCKQNSKVLGLILPIFSFAISALVPLNMMAPPEGVTVGFVFQLLLVWLIANIPTIIYMSIYFAYRKKIKKNNQLDKMSILDL